MIFGVLIVFILCLISGRKESLMMVLDDLGFD